VKNRSTWQIGFGDSFSSNGSCEHSGWKDGDQISDTPSYIINMLTLVPLVPALLSFTSSVHIGTISHRLHVQPPRMLISTLIAEAFGVLPSDAFGSVPSTFAALPQELSELAAPAHQKFSHIFLAACGGYTAFSAACTFMPLITRRFMGMGQEDDLEQFLANRPESSFGWHNADLRKPLPSTLEELSQMNGFPLGVHKGRRVYLCHIQPERVREAQTHLASFAEIEKSRDFSDFYGETVYVCFEHASGRPTTM
jgi:hypothetical protein